MKVDEPSNAPATKRRDLALHGPEPRPLQPGQGLPPEASTASDSSDKTSRIAAARRSVSARAFFGQRGQRHQPRSERFRRTAVRICRGLVVHHEALPSEPPSSSTTRSPHRRVASPSAMLSMEAPELPFQLQTRLPTCALTTEVACHARNLQQGFMTQRDGQDRERTTPAHRAASKARSAILQAERLERQQLPASTSVDPVVTRLLRRNQVQADPDPPVPERRPAAMSSTFREYHRIGTHPDLKVTTRGARNHRTRPGPATAAASSRAASRAGFTSTTKHRTIPRSSAGKSGYRGSGSCRHPDPSGTSVEQRLPSPGGSEVGQPEPTTAPTGDS